MGRWGAGPQCLHGLLLVLWQKRVCRELVAHRRSHRRGKLKLAKQIRCHCAENTIFHLNPQLISRGGLVVAVVVRGREGDASEVAGGIFKDRMNRVNKCWEAAAEEGMCVSGELGGQ